MPAVQSTYSQYIVDAYLGELADQGLCDVISREVETSGGIGFGLAVIRGSADHGVTVGADGKFVGFTVRDITLDSRRGDAYAHYDTAAIMTKGRLWVTAQASVSAGDPVYRKADGTLTNVVGTRSGASAAKSGGNTGNGTMGAITVSGALADGVYNLRITKANTNAGDFAITDKDGDVIGNGTVGVAYAFGGLAFTLADGATDFVVGDGFDITVSAGNVLIPNATWEMTVASTKLAVVSLS